MAIIDTVVGVIILIAFVVFGFGSLLVILKISNEPTIITTAITFKFKEDTDTACKIESEDEVTPVAKIEATNKKETAE